MVKGKSNNKKRSVSPHRPQQLDFDSAAQPPQLVSAQARLLQEYEVAKQTPGYLQRGAAYRIDQSPEPRALSPEPSLLQRMY